MRHDVFDLVTLRLYSSVIEEGNMARAAEREHITPSSVSRRITALEAHLGIRLLERTDRGVRPTAAGIDFHICAQEILSTIERTARKFDTFRNGAAGLVRIHAHTTAINPYLITKLRSFNHAAPNVDVIIEERMSAEIIEDIHSVKADIGIVSGTTDASGLTSHAWVSDELVAVLPRSSPLASVSPVSFLNVIDYPFIAMQRSSALYSLFENAAREQHRQFLPCAYMASFESVVVLVEAGSGVSILPKAYVTNSTRSIISVPLSEPWAKRQTSRCYRSTSLLSPTAMTVLDFLRRPEESINP
ncbi:LysR family transcriptional regulator [Novosphingobium arvoryzae]|nr:LysR family transcriptional regulator [Novosphingobium arvoryzae]